MRTQTSSIVAADRLDDQRVVVMGLGRFGGGVGVARWLVARGARVVVTDLADERVLHDSVTQLADQSIEWRLGGHDNAILEDTDLLIVSPAVDKQRSAFFRDALRREIPWTTEINLFLERCPASVVGVTGTVGKSTTAAMIHHVLQNAAASRCKAYLGGNIGRSLLDEVATMSRDDTVVLELSSFQLADLPRIARRPDLAVLVSLAAHHLERHGSAEAYLDCKLNMIRGAAPATPVVLGGGDEVMLAETVRVAAASGARIVPADTANIPPSLRVPGAHNRANARCAAAACELLGIDVAAINAGLESFTGLPHRLEFVGQYGGVDYYNDSKATTPWAAATGLRAFQRPLVALIGGRERAQSLEDFVAAVLDTACAAVCFGSAGPTLFQALQAAQPHKDINLSCVGALSAAVAVARCRARRGDVVVLSPGFDSFDAFANYEARGETFVRLVRQSAEDVEPCHS